jgi:hypothetical protein
MTLFSTPDWLGWLATAVFVASYFSNRPLVLRSLQMLGALLWLVYGALIGATPVIVANVLVFAAAAYTALRTWQNSGILGPHSR